MCGILAILFTNMEEPELRLLTLDRCKTLRHRGPDWNGMCIQKIGSLFNVLAHERLAIVDPTSGKQPLFDSCGDVAITVNGEIYNHKDLTAQLLPPEEVKAFSSASDCQPLPSLYKLHGPSICDRLDGMFAFVVSDRKSGKFLAARDPLGICPMYVGYSSDGSVWFASEMKALARDCEQILNFPPGHYFHSSHNAGEEEGGFVRYYKPSWWGPHAPLSTRSCNLQDLRDALLTSVQKRLMCDVPFGLLLSGGLNSAIVAAVAVREFQKHSASEMDSHLWTHKVHSFSIGMKNSPALQYTRTVAEALGTIHHEFNFELEEGLNALQDVISMIESYDVETVRGAVPMYLLCRLIKSLGIKVVLTGEGGDEVFGGLPHMEKITTREAFQRELQRKLELLQYYGLLRANKASMAWGIEARVPFLDRAFLNFAMTIDPENKMWKAGRLPKQILRDAFKGYIPDECLYCEDEADDNGACTNWIAGLKAYADQQVTEHMMRTAKVLFPYNTPTTKEAYLYRKIFAKHYQKECAARTVYMDHFSTCNGYACSK